MIEPSNGRIVLFGPEKLAAIVTHVHSERMVNLCVFSPEGIPIPRTSVPLLQDEDEAPIGTHSYCQWMPYQKGQAAKTEALEKAAAA